MEPIGLTVIFLGAFITYAGVKDHNPYTLIQQLIADPRNFRSILTTPGDWTNTNADQLASNSGAVASATSGATAPAGTPGNLPASELQTLSWSPNNRLATDAANAAEQMNAAYKAAYGKNLAITSSYRTTAQQKSVKAEKGALAATPGHSMHERGMALDINVSGPTYQWLKANAGRFNFGQSLSYENWHWVYGGKELG